MKILETITPAESKEVTDNGELEYIRYIDEMISDILSERGVPEQSMAQGSRMTWYGDGIRVSALDSDWGNDWYSVSVAAWRSPGIPERFADYNGFYQVYSHKDGTNGDIVTSHVPGEWITLLEEISGRR